jgi:D-alanyl-D-alanine carboxypeptidase
MRPALLLAVAACAPDPKPGGRAGSLQRGLSTLVARDPRVPGALLDVAADGVAFTGAAGALSLDRGARALQPDDLFRVASVTKTFVAVAALRAQEDGLLRLDDPISALLSSGSLRALEGGGYDPDAIQLRMLLAHTAGIYDYTESAAFYAVIADDPEHRWTRAEQLQLAMDEGRALHAPGEDYRYGDTHYILAAEALERATGLGLADALRAGWAPLELPDTFLESLEPAPEGADARLSHPYFGRDDTRGWDPSWDLYGGGGLVSSTADLRRFFVALFGGELLGEAAMDELLTVPAVAEGAFYGIDGALGLGRFPLQGDGDCYGGYGLFSTEVVHCPGLGATWAGTQNQSNPRAPGGLTRLALGAL